MKVEIPDSLYKKIEERARSTGFENAQEYIVFVLEEVLKNLEEEKSDSVSEEDEEKIKERLRALGYLE